MLDLRDVAKNFEAVAARLADRGGRVDLGDFKKLFEQRKLLHIESEALAQKRNAANEEMKRLVKSNPGALEQLRGDLRALSTQLKERDEALRSVEAQLEQLLLTIPNVPHPSVPVGKSADDNPVVRTWGQKPNLLFPAKTHDEIGQRLGLLDFERAAKVSGPRFAFLRGPLAKLERALVSLMADLHSSAGWEELQPPYLVNRASMTGTGQLPKFEEDAFKTSGAGELFLIPTAEVPVTNYHADEILDGATLPRRYFAFSPCFRSEAGAAGKDTRGLIRMHQFHKVELVEFCRPEDSDAELERLTEQACRVLQVLGLHYRVVLLCTGDVGFSSQKTYDVEVWLPGQNAYREISSCSNFGDFQARRAKIRYRAAAGEKPTLVHTLNGSGLAVGRTLVALLENYQREDGSVVIPEALKPYMGAQSVLGPSGPHPT